MHQIRATWSGFSGSPGISTFYCDAAANPDLTHLAAFFAALTGYIPTGVQITFPTSGDTLNPTTGALVSNWSVGSAPAAVTMSGSGPAASAQGPEVVWTTNDVADGRAVKGRTFLVPAAAGIFGTDGQLTTAVQTSIYTAGGQIVGATPTFVVWHRPKRGPKPAGGGPSPITRTGSWSVITGRQVPRKVAVLSSRRD